MKVEATSWSGANRWPPDVAELPPLGQAVLSTVAYDGPGDNEDALAVWNLDTESAVLAIADGAGGLPQGKAAARAALQALDLCLRGRADGQIEGASLRSRIMTGFELANRRVRDLRGAATTLLALEIQPGIARCFHAGDSGATIFGQRGRVKFRTVDHSPVGFGEAAGLIEPAEAMFHEHRHLVSNMLGDQDMKIDVGPTVALAPLDTVVLGSDGLWDNLHFDEVIDLLRAGPLVEGVEATCNLARSRMGLLAGELPSAGRSSDEEPGKPDDLTVIAFRQSHSGQS